ncbi:MAG: hypothetical protein GY745_19425 [Actinomycetia bacterium]|nr:hypothetical protein [Actinomycetes bacterium]
MVEPSNEAQGPYGSAYDLPSYREALQQIQGMKLLTRVVAREQRAGIVEVEEQMKSLLDTVDRFYDRLGERSWIFHDLLSPDAVGAILDETDTAEEAEQRLIELYQDSSKMKFWVMRLRNRDGLRQRSHQIERAHAHYQAGCYDSCVLHLIAVMDGFVSDFQAGERKGLHARKPEEMYAWDSVVGHHLGLTHAMQAFLLPMYKRRDESVFEVHRHGIMHGAVTQFDNEVVASKAWNMLFALADWATATEQSAKPQPTPPTLGGVWSQLKEQVSYRRVRDDFEPFTVEADSDGFEGCDGVGDARRFLDSWVAQQWGRVAEFCPTQLRGSKSKGQQALFARDTFGRYPLTRYQLNRVTYDQVSTMAVEMLAVVDAAEVTMTFRMVRYKDDHDLAVAGESGAWWELAVWAPHTYLDNEG